MIGNMVGEDIKRSDIIRMLDKIEDENGPGQADVALGYTRRIFSWHEERHDDFRPPIGKMKTRRTSSRERVLTDDEIRAVWGVQGFWGDFSRLLLLTAARRTELAGMSRDELSGSLWTIPAARVKNGKEVARATLTRCAADAVRDADVRWVQIHLHYGRPRGGDDVLDRQGFSRSGVRR